MMIIFKTKIVFNIITIVAIVIIDLILSDVYTGIDVRYKLLVKRKHYRLQ